MMSHYYSKNPDSEIRLKKIFFELEGERISFITGSGTFSLNKVDRGSEILIKYCEIGKSSKVLDIGCGYGAIGICIAKKFPDSSVLMTDINSRAVQLSKQNIKLNEIKNAQAIEGNLYEDIEGNFDAILSNPPHSAGKKVCFSIIEGAKKLLAPKGTFYLVARKNKGGETLSKKMLEVFGNLEVKAKKSGYWLYMSRSL